MRPLVHEYGAVIVCGMIEDGHCDADELAFLLEHWRIRRQEQWLATDYITRRSRQAFFGARY